MPKELADYSFFMKMTGLMFGLQNERWSEYTRDIFTFLAFMFNDHLKNLHRPFLLY